MRSPFGDRATTHENRLAQVLPQYKRIHAGEKGTLEAAGIMNMYAAEELVYGIAWVEKKRKRSSRTSCAEACDGFSAS